MNKGFTIICNECGSSNVEIKDVIEYDWDENPYIDGYYLECNECGNDYN